MNTVQKVFEFLIGLMNNAIGILIALALFAFLWGVLKYFINANAPDKRKESVKYITYGLISLLVIVSVWGFVYLLADTLNINIGQSNYQGDIAPESDINTGIFDHLNDQIVS